MRHRFLVAFAVRCTLTVALVALSACGDSGSSTAAPGFPIVATLGDSITAGAPRWSPNPDLRAMIAAHGGQLTRESQWQYWAGAETGGAFRFRNCGVEGDRTDEIEARETRCTAGADIVVIQGGSNDIAQGRPVAAAAANIRDMLRRAQEAGLRALVTTVPPINRRYPMWAGAVRRLNARIKSLARDAEVPVIDFFGLLEDPRRPDRMPARWTADGIHPTVGGYARLGRAAAHQLE